jgi:tetraacyldisaccharide 4'-kinase
MKAPAFWSERPGLLAFVLWPLGWVYGKITLLRMNQKAAAGVNNTLDIPVICVGNFTSGGAGKTPTVALIADLLHAASEKPFILSRGYGGSLVGPTLVDSLIHKSSDCGDEPLLLSRHAPTIIARDRLAGAKFAQASGASLIIMDDGLQSPALNKDYTIAVVDAVVGVGNGFCLPAGPLRAPVAPQSAFVDKILWIGGRTDDANSFLKTLKNDIALQLATLAPAKQTLAALSGQRLLAFAGIGRPQKFFETLTSAGLNVIETRSFADHHAYSKSEIDALRAHANKHSLQLVTTEKDRVRLHGKVDDIAVLPVSLLTDNAQLLAPIFDAIKHKRLAI